MSEYPAPISSLRDKPIEEGVLAFGEIGVGGEIRSVANISARVKEAQRLGFQKCLVPQQSLKQIGDIGSLSLDVVGVSNIRQAASLIAGKE